MSHEHNGRDAAAFRESLRSEPAHAELDRAE
jgi:hypothetical protein